MSAWQTDSGEIVFAERGNIRRSLSLPCGRCIGCRLKRAREWSIRCVHESQMHEHSAFVTLTYDEAHYQPSLDYVDFQLFMKRARKALGPLRFFACGEYGEKTLRPHFHALLFGARFEDAKVIRRSQAGTLFRSDRLSRLWGKGHASFGSVTPQSAAYCARYTLKKVSGPLAAQHYSRCDIRTGEVLRVQPEFARMSLKPAIGAPWFERYWREVYQARDGVLVHGKKNTPPRFYDVLLARTDPDLRESKDFDRYIRSEAYLADCTPDRLAVREIVETARSALNSRSL